MFQTDEKNKSIDKLLDTSHSKITKAWNEGNNQLRNKSINKQFKSKSKVNKSFDQNNTSITYDN